jgi:hypothetical protein
LKTESFPAVTDSTASADYEPLIRQSMEAHRWSLYRDVTARNAKFTAIISTDIPGSTSRAFFNRVGSPAPMDPMMRELTASPIQLDVIAIPIAVPVMRGNRSPMSATVVGKTGAMDMPARKVTIHATVGLRVCNMANVMIAIKTDAAKVTVRPETEIRI